MGAWAAMDGLGQGADSDAVTDAIDQQLDFASHFRDFAVRNLNNDALAETDPPETVYSDLDPSFHDGVAPSAMRPGTVSPDRSLHLDETVPPLAGRYHDITIAEDARDVLISIEDLAPSSAVDGDAIVHIADGWWERRPLAGGKLQFCRDDEDASDDIDKVYLVISNHDRHETVSGFVKASAKDSCEPDVVVLEGTITGTATEIPTASTRSPDRTHGTIDGSMNVTITVAVDDWSAEGTARISGEYTGDCTYDDAGSGPFERTMRDFKNVEDGEMGASVEIDASDPRYFDRPLDHLVIAAVHRHPAMGWHVRPRPRRGAGRQPGAHGGTPWVRHRADTQRWVMGRGVRAGHRLLHDGVARQLQPGRAVTRSLKRSHRAAHREHRALVR